jgi:predicted AlkP superfamily phosphohydrolase/phosphomutase
MMRNLFGGRARGQRVVVIGLDCASPHLVFDQFHDELPVLSQLMAGGTWGELQSAIPCITVPAWSSMMTGRDPGVLGIYGFRNRADYSYAAMTTADSAAVRHPRLWDTLSEAGRDSVVIGVPQTYPVRPIKGQLVSCLLTPNTDSLFTYPAMLKQEVLNLAPNYSFDTRNFRTYDKAHLLEQILEMNEAQHRVVLHELKTKSWDFFMYVNIGVDRMHHGFWHFHDPSHRLYEPGNPYENAIRDYYRRVDRQLGEILEAADGATVLVVSDHGVSRMDGGICINEWLWRNGWLTLRTPPARGEFLSVEQADVDWSRTRAWASGGYYGRVFLNVYGREPQGIIPPNAYEATRDELKAALEAIPAPDGSPLDTRIFKPQEIYSEVNGIPPDLMVYFGGLHWRAVGSLGYNDIYTFENDTGPDDANHAEHGMFILYDPRQRGAGQVSGYNLLDIAPTLLTRMGLKVPPEMQGRPIVV